MFNKAQVQIFSTCLPNSSNDGSQSLLDLLELNSKKSWYIWHVWEQYVNSDADNQIWNNKAFRSTTINSFNTRMMSNNQKQNVRIIGSNRKENETLVAGKSSNL